MKRPSWRRILSALISLVMCGALLASCNNGSTQNDSKPSGEADEFDFQGDYDFKQETITIKAFSTSTYGFQKEGESASGDYQIKWRRAFEKKYNCKLKVEALTPFDTYNSLIVKIQAGDKVADVISCHRADVEKMRLAGNLLLDISLLPQVDLNYPTWDKTMTEAMTYNKKVLAVSANRPTIQACFLYNIDLLKELKLESPYTYVKNKTWNYDKFIEYCRVAKKDINGDGVFDIEDRYGAALFGEGVMTLLHNNGVQYIEKQSDGTMKNALNNQNTIDTINYLKEKLVIPKLVPELQTSLEYIRMFKESRLLFYPGPVWYVAEGNLFADCDFDVGMVPIPLGPKGKDYSHVIGSDAGVLCMTSTNSDPVKGAVLLQGMAVLAKGLRNISTNEYKDKAFAHDPDSYEAYEMLIDKAHYDWALPTLGVGINELVMMPLNALLLPEVGVKASFDELESKMNAAVEDTFNKNLK